MAPWDAGMAMRAHGATRPATAATHWARARRMPSQRRASLLMNGNLPDANDGAGWRFVRAFCCWQRSRGRPAGQPVALRRPSARTNFRGGALRCGCAVKVELVRGRAGWLRWRGWVAVAWVGCRGERRLESRNRGGQPKVHPLL